jgi:hypothetical protein
MATPFAAVVNSKILSGLDKCPAEETEIDADCELVFRITPIVAGIKSKPEAAGQGEIAVGDHLAGTTVTSQWRDVFSSSTALFANRSPGLNTVVCWTLITRYGVLLLSAPGITGLIYSKVNFFVLIITHALLRSLED